MNRGLAALLVLVLAGCATAPRPRVPPSPVEVTRALASLPRQAPQGALVIGTLRVPADVEIGGRHLQVSPEGDFVFGIGRDARDAVVVSIRPRTGRPIEQRIAVLARDWPVERIVGAPPETVSPPPELAARIAREQALVDAARTRDDARSDFRERFDWPVRGRISGRFGNQRIYVLPDGSEAAKAPHSGMDIAVPQGTPVLAPAAGVVTFADPGLYLTGGTVVLDHGHGVSSNFLHLSRIDVRVGDRLAQGQVLGAVGATGRATGPHLHWGMNWFGTRIDPLLVLERGN